MEPKKKNQHFVPRFLLRNFSVDRKSVGTYVLARKLRIDRANIGDQCARDYLYGREPHMENAFAESEGKVSALLRSFSPDHLEQLAAHGEYITRSLPSPESWRMLRMHPLYLIREFAYYQRHRTAGVADDADARIDRQIKFLLSKDPKFADLLENVRLVSPNTMSHLLYEVGPRHVVVFDLAVKFLVANHGAPPFVISDDPVAAWNQYADRVRASEPGPGALGIPARGLQMFLPLSPHVTLALYDPEVYEYGAPNRAVARVGKKDVHVLNLLQARNARRCVYFHPPSTSDGELTSVHQEWTSGHRTDPVFVEGPVSENGDGTFTQTTAWVTPDTMALPRLSCVRVVDRTTRTVRRNLGRAASFPVRSPEGVVLILPRAAVAAALAA